MGISSKTQKTTSDKATTQQTHGTSMAQTTANVPDWLLKPAQNMAGQIGTLMGQGSQSFAPKVSGQQQQAWDASGRLTQGGWGWGNARDVANSSGSVLDGLSNYYNPFADQVLNPVMASFDDQAGRALAAQSAQGAQGAFRGSRFGVREGQTMGQLGLARGQLQGGLLKDMYGQATALSAADQDRKLQKGGLLSQIANDQSSGTRQNLALADQMGGEATTADNSARQYPLTFAGQTEGLLQGLDPSQFSGKTINSTEDGTMSGTEHGTEKTDQSDSLFSQLGQAAQIAALFM